MKRRHRHLMRVKRNRDRRLRRAEGTRLAARVEVGETYHIRASEHALRNGITHLLARVRGVGEGKVSITVSTPTSRDPANGVDMDITLEEFKELLS